MRRAALLLAALALASSCRARPRAAADTFPGAPVVLVSIDTLRADHLPAYGYAGVETPALDRFRRDAILYRNAFSPCPMTLPSHVTMLTGLLPPEHGVRTNVGFDVKAGDSLPARLKARGYATGAAVSAYVLRRETGLGALFDWYDDAMDPGPGAAFAEYQRPGDVAASLVADWIAARGAQPFFAFLHLYEPHVPYAPPEPFRSRYAARPYDGEIAAADAIVGRFLDRLRATGVYDRALVIVTSDHGEGLGDHGEAQHSILLYAEDIRVPLLVKLPGAAHAGRAVDAPAQLSDLLPTVMEVVAGEAPAGEDPAGKGASLLHLEGASPRTLYAETLYPRLQLGWSELRSLTDARAHYIAGPRPELYDLASDPREARDLAREQGARAADLQRVLDTSFPLRLAVPAAVDPETAERLGALGYVGAPRDGGGAGPRLNPRDALPAFARLQEAARLVHDGRPDEAERAYRALLHDAPDMTDAWIQLGDLVSAQGRGEDAVSAYDEALRRVPGLADVVLSRGLAELKAGRHEAAEADATRARARLPRRAEELLARIALARGRNAEAEAHARSAVSLDAEPRPSALVVLATVLAREGDYAGALATVDAASRRAEALRLGAVREMEAVRADVLARAGRPAEAEAAYGREIAAFPDDLQAWANLAVLRFLRGDRAGVDALLAEMTRKNPGPRAARVASATRSALSKAPPPVR